MGNKMKPKLSIIIPAYNEEKRISETLYDFLEFFKKNKISYEILVMMDGCTDKTPEIVEEIASQNKNIRYRVYPEKQGKGGALLNGFGLVKGEYVAYTDADGATPPKEILRLMGLIGKYDGVIGSRWMKGSVIIKKQRPVRRIASRGFNILTRLLLGLPYKDTQCSAKVFKAGVAKTVAKNLTVTNFAIDASILYIIKRMGYRIKEVPIRWEDKAMSSLKISSAVPNMFITLLKLRLKGH